MAVLIPDPGSGEEQNHPVTGRGITVADQLRLPVVLSTVARLVIQSAPKHVLFWEEFQDTPFLARKSIRFKNKG